MIIYLAGGITGNLINEWRKLVNIYLASLSSKKSVLKPLTNAFLNGGGYRKERFKISTKNLNILESYFYIRPQKWMFPLIKEFNNFLLDSGAFTFMNTVA